MLRIQKKTHISLCIMEIFILNLEVVDYMEP